MTSDTRGSLVIPNSQRTAVKAGSPDEASARLTALETELESEASARTVSFERKGLTLFVTRLSTGELALHRPLTAEEVREHPAVRMPAFQFYAFINPDDPEQQEMKQIVEPLLT